MTTEEIRIVSDEIEAYERAKAWKELFPWGILAVIVATALALIVS